MKSLLTLVIAIGTLTVSAEKQPLSRYQSIIDRRPFGQPPPGYDPDSTVLDASAAAGGAAMTAEQLSQEQEQLQKSVSFSIMNINTDGSVSVGFSDKTDPKKPSRYYLKVGESREGWTVKSVDVAAQSMVLDKDGVEFPLTLGASAKPAAGAKGTRGSGRTLGANGTGRSGLLRSPGAPAADGNTPMSFASRRARRAQEAAALEKERADLEAERKRQAEESAAKAAEEKAARDEERAATRQQLLAIQEELRKAREEKAQQREQQENGNEENES